MFLSRTALLSAILASCTVGSTAAFPPEIFRGDLHRRLAGEDHGHGDHALEGEQVVPIGSIRPEGTHALSASDVEELGLDEGSYILVSEFFAGGVNLLNTDTLEYTNLIPSSSFQARGGSGVFYEFGHIIVGGFGVAAGTPFEINIYDPSTKELVATCADPDVEPGFFNDIDVLGETAYVTDSMYNRLWSFNVPAAIAGNCELSFVELDEEVFLGAGTDAPIRANGIVAYDSGFIIALFYTGGLYYVDPANNVSEAIVPLGELPLADGLELVSEEDGTDTLYATQGNNQISVFKITMEDGATAPSAELIGDLHTDAYEAPATSAVLGDMIWTANLGPTNPLPLPGEEDPATFDVTFEVVGANRFVSEKEHGDEHEDEHEDEHGDEHEDEHGDEFPTPAPSGSPTISWFGHTCVGLVASGLLLVFF